jgi:hypothetical protein
LSPNAAPAARERAPQITKYDVLQHARGCKRLTDALTKLLMPGTIMRETSD